MPMLVSQAHPNSEILPGVLAFLIGLAGWFYLFYSRAAVNLASLEDQQLNRRRVWLRRTNAVLMLVLAILIAVGYYWFDLERVTPAERRAFVGIWLAVLVLLAVILVLAIVDVRLTFRLRHTLRERRKHP
jgi:hypothetical protein